MKRCILTLPVAVAIVLIAGLLPAMSQDNPGEKKAPANPAQPGAEHKWLAEDAGDWTIKAKMFQPGQDKAFEVSGKSTMEMLWGRYLKEEFTIGEGDFAMRGLGLMAYDNQAGQFKSVYCLNTGTSLSISTGTLRNDVLVFENEDTGPDEVKITSRSVVTRKTKDERVLEYFAKRGEDPEQKKFEMIYTRTKQAE